MGYFRFRRSFQILPGIRWNLGKKSSSVSLGGRGFHYTIGPHGNRTTVGLPGTGLSYTTVSGAKQPKGGSDQDMAKALAWAKTQEKAYHLSLPNREPNEKSATPDQIQTIHDMVHAVQGFDMSSLGINQATFLIKEIQEEKARFTAQKVQEYMAMQKSKIGSNSCLMVLCFIVLAIVFAFLKSNHH